MSHVVPGLAICPRCGHEQRTRWFDSLNGEIITAQLERVVAGQFEAMHCSACTTEFRPEHRMLFTHPGKGLWIVMFPRDERTHFATLERGVELVMGRELASAPPVVAASIQRTRPRVVFGQDMLGEAVCSALAGLDAALLECAKITAFRQNLQRFLSFGPIEICFDHIAADGELVHRVVDLSSREARDTLRLPADAIARARAEQAAFEQSFPDLFQQPYISACRYLYGATV